MQEALIANFPLLVLLRIVLKFLVLYSIVYKDLQGSLIQKPSYSDYKLHLSIGRATHYLFPPLILTNCVHSVLIYQVLFHLLFL